MELLMKEVSWFHCHFDPSLICWAVYDQSDKKTLLDDYQYGMYGKVFKYTSEKAPSVKVYVLIPSIIRSFHQI